MGGNRGAKPWEATADGKRSGQKRMGSDWGLRGWQAIGATEDGKQLGPQRMGCNRGHKVKGTAATSDAEEPITEAECEP